MTLWTSFFCLYLHDRSPEELSNSYMIYHVAASPIKDYKEHCYCLRKFPTKKTRNPASISRGPLSWWLKQNKQPSKFLLFSKMLELNLQQNWPTLFSVFKVQRCSEEATMMFQQRNWKCFSSQTKQCKHCGDKWQKQRRSFSRAEALIKFFEAVKETKQSQALIFK